MNHEDTKFTKNGSLNGCHCEPTGRRSAPPEDRLREATSGRLCPTGSGLLRPRGSSPRVPRNDDWARSRGAAAVGEGGLGAGDEFEEAGVAVFVLLAGAQDRVADLAGVVDPLAPAAEVLADRGVVAAEVAGAVLFVRGLHRLRFDRHRRVVEDDRRNGDAA